MIVYDKVQSLDTCVWAAYQLLTNSPKVEEVCITQLTVQEPNTEDDPQFVSFGGGHFLPTLEDMLALGAYTLVRYWV